MIICQIVVRISKKIVSFDDILHLIDEEKIASYVDSGGGFIFYPESPTKFRQINRERNSISRSFEKTNSIPSNDQHNFLFDEQHTSIIFLNPYKLWDMVAAALMSLNHTNDRDCLSNQDPQTTNHQSRTDSNPVFSSLRTMDRQRKESRVNCAFFQKN